MHKENIFDLFNKQNPAPADDPALGDVVKAEDVKPDIVKPEDEQAEDKPEDKPAEEKPEDKPAEGSEDDV